MSVGLSAVEYDAEGFKSAVGESGSKGFGFFDDFTPELFEPIQATAGSSSIGFFEDQDPEDPSVIPEIMALRGLFLSVTQQFDPDSNLGYGHVFRRTNGGTSGHRDINPDNPFQGAYKMGRYRVGLNLLDSTVLFYETPLGERQQRIVNPGGGYVINLNHNPWHASRSNEPKPDKKSGVLLMTDVAERSIS